MTKHTLARFGRAVSPRPPHSGGTAVSKKPLCRSLRRGVTLVELMISMLILVIVCLSWFEILSIQSAKREALRREGVERLAGMMEAFLASFNLQDGISSVTLNSIGDFLEGDAVIYNPDALAGEGGYMFTRILSSDRGSKMIRPIFSDDEIKSGRLGAASPGYRLYIGLLGTSSNSAMDYNVARDGQTNPLMMSGAKILVGDLFEGTGEIDDGAAPRRICRLKMFMRNSF